MAQINIADVERYTPDILQELITRLGYREVVTRIELDKCLMRRTYVIAALFKIRPVDREAAGIALVEVAYEFMEDLAGSRNGVSNYGLYEMIAKQLCEEIDRGQLDLTTPETIETVVVRRPIGQGVARLEPEQFHGRITRTQRPHVVAMGMRRYNRRKEWKQTEELSVSPAKPRLRLRTKRNSS